MNELYRYLTLSLPGEWRRLPEATRHALRGWTEEAQALAEARAALRSLAGG